MIRDARTCRPVAVLFLLSSLLLALQGAARAQENDACLECHGKSDIQAKAEDKTRSLFVDPEAYAASVHGDFACIDCHMDLEDAESPHPKNLDRVDCTMCHDEDEILDVLTASLHGRAQARGVPDAPSCADCHGKHDILFVSEKEAKKAIHGRCANCHAVEGAMFDKSLHGQAFAREDPLAPICMTCHGGHDVRPATDQQSPISFHYIPRLCGRCHKEGAPVQAERDVPHEDVLTNYSESIHGEGLYKKGLTVTAVCTSCHTPHNILKHDDPESSIHPRNIAATCAKCHILIEEVHRKFINGELWEKEPHKIPVCVDCHAPHKARRVFYDQGMADKDCLSCHADPDLAKSRDGNRIPLHVDYENLQNSMHSGVACAQCHTGATPSEFRACSTIVEGVDCSICHPEQVDQYASSIHGQLAGRRDPEAPACADCHEPHHTLGKENPRSPTFPRHIPDLCGRCHREGEAAARRKHSRETEVLSNYSMSVHGKGLLQSGLIVTAVCTNCHTAHMELPAADPRSSVNRKHIPGTCAKCHHGIYEQFARSIHANGNGDEEHDLPGCSDCHSSHTITRIDRADFKADIIDKCGRCHEEVTQTYFETYHGKASRLGSEPAARCHHCHGAHDILPPTDLDSRLSRDNILTTCRQCHEEAHRMFAGYLTHATHHNRVKYPLLFYSFWGMTILLVGTLSVALLHTLLWAWRSIRAHRGGEIPAAAGDHSVHVLRFTPFQRGLHLTMLLSFFVLAVTGMALKFSYTEWAQAIMPLLGGVESAGFLHRVCAVVTFGYFFAHLFSLLAAVRREGWKSIFSKSATMLPTRNDWEELKATWKWFLGKGEPPRYGRWTYWEKFDYFAVFWGVAVIGTTGLMLWFPEFFTRFIPGQLLNVASIIHSDEALLAVGFIFTIHFFNTHFRPSKFPMDPVIFTGTVPLKEFKLEREREYEELKASGRLGALLCKPKSKGFLRAARIFGLCALALGLIMIGLIIFAMIFKYR